MQMQKIQDRVLDGVFEAVVSAPVRKPSSSLPRRLTPLFRELAQVPPKRNPDEVTEIIWALWISHGDVNAANTMVAAIEAMAAGAADLARPILDRLVEENPHWAEAWNKRAVLAFLEKRDQDSLMDIGRTIELEPRHFGAILGFAQICMRQNHLAEAKAAIAASKAARSALSLGVSPFAGNSPSCHLPRQNRRSSRSAQS